MNSTVAKRSIIVGGHKTSISLEDEFWDSLKKIAAAQNTTLSTLVSRIDSERRYGNLSSAVRLFVFSNCRAAPTDTRQEPNAPLDEVKRQTALSPELGSSQIA